MKGKIERASFLLFSIELANHLSTIFDDMALKSPITTPRKGFFRVIDFIVKFKGTLMQI